MFSVCRYWLPELNGQYWQSAAASGLSRGASKRAVTGCSSGIGQALAQLIVETPNRLVATARKLDSLSSIPTSARAVKLELDVTTITSIETALRATLETFGRVDVVVNNAGYTLVGNTEGATEEEARALMDTNFWGTVDVTKRALGIMQDENPKSGGQKGGVVLNMSSMGVGWASRAAPFITPTNYATTSLEHMAKQHPAYTDPSYPTNALVAYMQSEQNRSTWAEPSAVAAAIYQAVSRGKRIPIRVPLGHDSWGMIAKDLEDIKRNLDELKEISVGVGDPKQLESINFLK
ncbi:hypothetical protein DL762_007911 [Monosporascus cannonballus]|uniref:NAD(P)-binding protein n=1 Tax=Monosporascus cannonballus TaxID=155416 RepID=A0ABY0GXQ1_9PEZI|nr:hypothetical protein DL762_007911 [Monosporascus cannonballus]